MIPLLIENNIKVATIKHDGHDFEPDVPETDSYKHRQSGAYGVAVFSNTRYMITKETENSTIQIGEIIQHFDDADIILLEGFKNSDFDKLEVIRFEKENKDENNKENKDEKYLEPYCQNNVLGYITDEPSKIKNKADIPIFTLNDYSSIAKFILKKAEII